MITPRLLVYVYIYIYIYVCIYVYTATRLEVLHLLIIMNCNMRQEENYLRSSIGWDNY